AGRRAGGQRNTAARSTRIEPGDDVGHLRGLDTRPRNGQCDRARLALRGKSVEHGHGEYRIDAMPQITVERDADGWSASTSSPSLHTSLYPPCPRPYDVRLAGSSRPDASPNSSTCTPIRSISVRWKFAMGVSRR